MAAMVVVGRRLGKRESVRGRKIRRTRREAVIVLGCCRMRVTSWARMEVVVIL